MLFHFRKTTVAALCAAAIGGIALATPAQAAQIGSVRVYVDKAKGHTKEWTRLQSTGMAECRATYPSTKSVKMVGTGGVEPNIYTLWDCLN